MSGKWLYLPIEGITRELDGKLLLAYYAVKNNFNVIIGMQRSLYNYVQVLPKGIWLSKGYPKSSRIKKGPLRLAKEIGHKVVELDEEGLIFNQNMYQRRINKTHFALLDEIYCWGNRQRDYIFNIYGDSNKVHLTGHPRFDLVKEKFHGLYKEEVEKIQKQFGEFILINTRFDKYNGQKGFNLNEPFIKTLYEHFIDMTKQLSQQYPDYNFVLRPHPRENIHSYQIEFENFNNVFTIHEGSIAKWNLASKLIIHNGCTTGIEAFLMNKPVISYMPVTSEEHIDEYLANAVSDQVQNIEELISYINHYLVNPKVNEEQKQARTKILSNFYSALGDHYAYENLVHLLDMISHKIDTSNTHVDSLDGVEVAQGRSQISKDKVNDLFARLDDLEGEENYRTVKQIKRHLVLIKPQSAPFDGD